jgi:hypothetical protein
MNHRIACLLGIASYLMPTMLHADKGEDWGRRTLIGVQTGLSLANIGGSERNDPGVDYSYRKGFTGGGILALRLTQGFSTQIELGFVTKGFRADTLFPSTSGTQYLAYLEIPLLVQATLPFSDTFEPYLNLGPALGILLDSDIRFDDGKFDETDRGLRRFDVGLILGGGGALDVGRMGVLTVEVRYTFGVRNLNTSEVVPEAFNRAIYLTVGYRVDLAMLGRLFGGAPR